MNSAGSCRNDVRDASPRISMHHADGQELAHAAARSRLIVIASVAIVGEDRRRAAERQRDEARAVGEAQRPRPACRESMRPMKNVKPSSTATPHARCPCVLFDREHEAECDREEERRCR